MNQHTFNGFEIVGQFLTYRESVFWIIIDKQTQ